MFKGEVNKVSPFHEKLWSFDVAGGGGYGSSDEEEEDESDEE